VHEVGKAPIGPQIVESRFEFQRGQLPVTLTEALFTLLGFVLLAGSSFSQVPATARGGSRLSVLLRSFCWSFC
jgi:hypothetical protein